VRAENATVAPRSADMVRPGSAGSAGLRRPTAGSAPVVAERAAKNGRKNEASLACRMRNV
jgi:hypothetical protein